jgi:hypothetical protein
MGAMQGNLRTATIQVSVSEIVDRATILKIKLGRSNHRNIEQLKRQYQGYLDELARLNVESQIHNLQLFLARVNQILWRLEDAVRRHEAQRSFDLRFICAARMIIKLNDRRARIKAKIDEVCSSQFSDSKIYSLERRI